MTGGYVTVGTGAALSGPSFGGGLVGPDVGMAARWQVDRRGGCYGEGSGII